MSNTSVNDESLMQLVEAIEALEEEKASIANDIKEKYAEAKLQGFDPKILRKVISMRKMEQDERDQEQSLLFLYMQALGMYTNPTGE